ncbi:hypothetical protein ACA910_009279 [Epithemia clementina (nom. ined.)]
MPRSDSSMVTNQGTDWMNRTGSKFTNLISNTTCVRLCSLYVDEQVEYEIRQEDCVTTMDRMMSVVSSVGAASIMAPARAAAAAGSLEVEMYKQFLFDEESVLTSLSEREDEDQEDDEQHLLLTNARTNSVHRQSGGVRALTSSAHPQQRDLESVKSHDEEHMTIVTQRTH